MPQNNLNVAIFNNNLNLIHYIFKRGSLRAFLYYF